jgi:octaprenyl-diphosphate synthase
MDIFWHRTPGLFPTKEEYRGMVRCKTGTLASMAAKIGFLAGGASEEEAEKAGETAANIGMGFQIIDDVINLTSGNPGKKRGDDIVEGKKSLPVLIHTEKNPDDAKVIASLMEKASREGIDSVAVEECISLLEKSGCIKEAAIEGKKLITENLDFFKSDLISDLFKSMIPEDFR